DARGGVAQLIEVNGHVCAETSGHLQPVFRATDENDLSGSGVLRDRERSDADRARALDENAVTPGERQDRHLAALDIRGVARAVLFTDALDAVNRGDQGATCANDGLGRQIGSDFENICARMEIMKFGVTAQQMRRLVASITNAVGATLWAARRLAFLGT